MHEWLRPRRRSDPPPHVPLDQLPDDELRRYLLDEALRAKELMREAAAVARAKAEKESRQMPKEERSTDD